MFMVIRRKAIYLLLAATAALLLLGAPLAPVYADCESNNTNCTG